MTKKSSRASIIILAVIILILAAWFFSIYLPDRASQRAPAIIISSTTPISSQTPQPLVKTDIDDSKLPPGFPTDVPLEARATITQNYTEPQSGGRLQSSREFISAKSAADNFSLYQTALKKNGWTIVQVLNNNGNKSFAILATKDNNYLSIIISTNAKGQVSVSINNVSHP